MRSVITGALRQMLREFGRRPMHTTVVVGTIAVAIGANAALFTATQTLLVGSLPFDEPERVGTIRGVSVTTIGEDDGWALTDAFLGIPGVQDAAYYTPNGAATLTASRNRRVQLAFVSPAFFDVLGVSLALGPGLRDVPVGSNAVVLGHAMWTRDFGADPGVLDRDVVLNGRAFRVVGVAPPEVAWPADAELWLGYPVEFEFISGAYGAHPLARLAAGVPVESIQAALRELQEADRAIYSAAGREMPTPEFRPIRDELVGDLRGTMVVLSAAAALILLLGALNLASVWLHRVLEREGELTTRRALGASRLRLVAQLTAEATALSLVGGLAALVVAAAGTRLLAARLPGMIPGVSNLGITPGTIAVATGLALGVGIVIGGVAAFRGSAGASAGSRVGRTRSRARTEFLLLAGQATVASVLVATSILTVRSLGQLTSTPLGFDPDGTLALTVQIPEAEAATTDDIQRYVETLASELRDIGRVESLGWTDRLPLAKGMFSGAGFRPVEGDTSRTVASWISASDDYFDAAGLEMLAGRGIGTDWVSDEVVIDQTLATALFPADPLSAVGSRIEYPRYEEGVARWTSVSVRGVVEAQRQRGPRSNATPIVYRRIEGRAPRQVGFLARVRGNPSSLAAEVEARARAANPAIVPGEIRSLRAAADAVVSTDRTLASVLTGFAVAGLLLAALGLYGVTARHVAGRRRELGVRLALGANPAALVVDVARHGTVVGAVAAVLAAPGALLAARALDGHLYDGLGLGIGTLLGASALVVAVTTISAWVPARRVARIAPRDALSVE